MPFVQELEGATFLAWRYAKLGRKEVENEVLAKNRGKDLQVINKLIKFARCLGNENNVKTIWTFILIFNENYF